MKRQRFSFRAFFKDTSGTILLITGLAFLFLVGIAGAGYDLGRQQLVRQRIQQASDAAALAAAGRAQGTSDTVRYNTALNVYSLNYPTTYFGISRPAPTINVVTDINVSVSATTTVPTSFVGNLGITSLTATGRTVAQIRKDINKVDVIMVLDNSGSMAINYDVGSTDSQNAASDIRGYCINGWINYGYGPASNANSMCDFWEGANGFNRLNALRYSTTKLTDDLINPNPNDHRIAVVTWDWLLIDTLGFTNDPVPVKAYLSRMYGRGATNSTYGLNQAIALSSGFRSDAIHAIILMTDGKNYPDQPGYNASSLAVCSAIKSQPRTIIFTIGFGAEVLGDPVAQQFLSDCATGPNGSDKPNQDLYYFPVSNSAQLKGAFDAITGNLKKVRILQ